MGGLSRRSLSSDLLTTIITPVLAVSSALSHFFSPLLGWLILCANVARSYFPDMGSNMSLGLTVKIFLKTGVTFKSIDFE